MFNATIMTSRGMIYKGPVWSVFLPGSTGEFEILDLHTPIVSMLKSGKIIIDWNKEILIKRGAVRMSGDRLVAIVER
ncbi:MAG: hypothetical protein PHI58_03820 [Candidatus Omnitrophica bacterium]|nr:hypothetical protein [Candidatus Omnitrophota bacterium]